MGYIENPKTKDSGIHCCIPQICKCPNNCPDCFFQSGRSYLEPLNENLPNIPEGHTLSLIRMNDGNDSNVQRESVMEIGTQFPFRFYNTSIPKDLENFDSPVVLTLNPGNLTDKRFHILKEIPANLMFVRIRTNMWNLQNVVGPAIEYYTRREVPVVLTFMAYYGESIQGEYEQFYSFRQRTLNSYWVITKEGWDFVVNMFADNKWVHTCGKSADVHACRFCGNCHREWWVAWERMRKES
jgi:hypothetical protein